MRIAIYGGAFDPPHVCHFLAAAYILATKPLDEFWFVPTFRHPFGKVMESFQDRLTMCSLLAKTLGPKVKASPVESEIEGEGKTLFLLKHLQKKYPDDTFMLVIGSDNYRDRHLWYGFDEIEKMVEILVVGRQGVPEVDNTISLPNVSSTEVRQKLSTQENVQYLLPYEVLSYIKKFDLYQEVRNKKT